MLQQIALAKGLSGGGREYAAPVMKKTLTSIELFAGGGGMALGMRLAGFEHLALVEWNKSAAAILRHNASRYPELWSEDQVIEDDVRNWLKGVDFADVDIVAGGPPCQPFSLGGIHAGDNDERNMFPAAIETLRRIRPKIAVFENVPGLTRPSFEPYFRYIKDQLSKPTVSPKPNEFWLDHHRRIERARPRSLRYVVHEHRIDAADMGLPQNRRRVFLVAIRSDVSGAATWQGLTASHGRDALLYDQWVSGDYWAHYDMPAPDLPPDLKLRIDALKSCGRPDTERWQTVRDAVSDLPEPIVGAENLHVADHRGIGGARAYPKHSGSAYDWPAKTIKAGVHGVSGGEAMIRFDDNRLRYLTVRESARIQGFPDDYHFPGARSRTMGAIGNAVAVPVAELLANRLISHCSLTALPKDARVDALTSNYKLADSYSASAAVEAMSAAS